jgi:hypothetical protein
MKRLDAALVSLAGFAASQWAEQQAANGSRNKGRLRELAAVGLELHIRSELYASAPDLLRSLQNVIAHASVAVGQTGNHEMPSLRKDDTSVGGGGGNGAKGRKSVGAA